MIAGVDGYRRGWVAAIDLGGGRTTVRAYPTFAALLQEAAPTVVVIDIPIGLLETGARRCDVMARRRLGRSRASSVFPAPLRPMLRAQSWEEACRIRTRIDNKRCSKQLWGLLAKIREVDAVMAERPELQGRVREGHPELCLAVLNRGRAMRHRKTTPAGRAERLRLLQRAFPDLPAHLRSVPGATTDVLDAYACLWTARRVLDGTACSLPEEAEHDARGLRAEIVV